MEERSLLDEPYRMTELGELPESWKVVRFEACLCNIKLKVNRIQQHQYKKVGKFPIIDQSQNLISGYWDNEEDLIKEPLPIIIFGDHTRVFKYIDFPFVCGPDGTKILIPDTTKFEPKFLYYYFLTLNIPNRGYNRHFSLLKEKSIPLPPLEEQKKIAYVLSVVQSAEEKVENLINALKEFKKSMMKHLFTYGAVSFQDREKRELKETEIGLIPREWEVVRLGEVLYEIDVRVRDFEEESTYKLPVLSLTKNEGLVLQAERFRKRIATEDVSQYKVVYRGQIVYNPYVIWEGAVHILDRYEAGLVSPVYLVWKVKENKAYAWFIDPLLRMPNAMNAYSRFASGAVNRRRAIRKNDFLSIPIPLPPLEEQKRIADILSAIDEYIEKAQMKRQALRELFKRLLKDLMTAKIRVKHINIEE